VQIERVVDDREAALHTRVDTAAQVPNMATPTANDASQRVATGTPGADTGGGAVGAVSAGRWARRSGRWRAVSSFMAASAQAEVTSATGALAPNESTDADAPGPHEHEAADAGAPGPHQTSGADASGPRDVSGSAESAPVVPARPWDGTTDGRGLLSVDTADDRDAEVGHEAVTSAPADLAETPPTEEACLAPSAYMLLAIFGVFLLLAGAYRVLAGRAAVIHSEDTGIRIRSEGSDSDKDGNGQAGVQQSGSSGDSSTPVLFGCAAVCLATFACWGRRGGHRKSCCGGGDETSGQAEGENPVLAALNRLLDESVVNLACFIKFGIVGYGDPNPLSFAHGVPPTVEEIRRLRENFNARMNRSGWIGGFREIEVLDEWVTLTEVFQLRFAIFAPQYLRRS